MNLSVEKFVDIQTEKQYTGSGIGLTICKRIADSINGRIAIVDNPIGGGTAFKIILPLTVLVL